MRVATWNVNSLKARMPRVEEWLSDVQPDVVCLQETKLSDAAFPALSFQALGYESVHHGQGQWNGVAILSRVGLDSAVHGFAQGAVGEVGASEKNSPVDQYQMGVLNEARVVTARCGGVLIVSVYVPNGRSLDDPHLGAKLVWLAALREHLAALSAPTDAVMVLGDFNIAPDDRDVWDPKRFLNSTHVTPAERASLDTVQQWGLVDLFRHQHVEDRLYTYWDYRAGDFHQHRGMRIDLALGTASVRDSLVWTMVDRNARKGKLPSDHAPVVVEIDDSVLRTQFPGH